MAKWTWPRMRGGCSGLDRSTPISASGRRSRSINSPTAKRSRATRRTRCAMTWPNSCADRSRRPRTNRCREKTGAPPRIATALQTETLHRASKPDRVEHGRWREVPVRQLPDETGLHHIDERGVHATVRGLGVDEIALLKREPSQIITRHGARFVELADEEIRQRLLRLTL